MVNRHVRPLIGWSEKMRDLHADIEKTAPTNLTVMIRGERGTGKELVAREIHLKSNRTGPFIRVNCASLPETLPFNFAQQTGARGICSKQGEANREHNGNARKRARPFTSKTNLLEGRRVQHDLL